MIVRCNMYISNSELMTEDQNQDFCTNVDEVNFDNEHTWSTQKYSFHENIGKQAEPHSNSVGESFNSEEENEDSSYTSIELDEPEKHDNHEELAEEYTELDDYISADYKSLLLYVIASNGILVMQFKTKHITWLMKLWRKICCNLWNCIAPYQTIAINHCIFSRSSFHEMQILYVTHQFCTSCLLKLVFN